MPSFQFIDYYEDDSTKEVTFDPTKDKDAVELLNMIADNDYKNLTEGFMNDSRYAQLWLQLSSQFVSLFFFIYSWRIQSTTLDSLSKCQLVWHLLSDSFTLFSQSQA